MEAMLSRAAAQVGVLRGADVLTEAAARALSRVVPATNPHLDGALPWAAHWTCHLDLDMMTSLDHGFRVGEDGNPE